MNFSVEWFPGFAVLILVGVLCAPLLGWLIALVAVVLVAMAALAALVGAIVAIPFLLLRSVRRRERVLAVASQSEELIPFTEGI
jgi:hypothetical protein